MSAIFGIINLNGKPVAHSDLVNMNLALEHHGADGGGLWAQGCVGMGERLMVFAPEDCFERQPLIGNDGQLVLVCDGRIDNRAELIEDLCLQAKGSTTRPISEIPDGELILRAYERWESKSLQHLVGVFAFAVWDVRAQLVFIARSPILAPPIFYFATPEVFAFSVMPKGLFALPFVPRAINEQKFADMLVRSPADPEATLYRGISRIPTGSYLTAGRDGLRAQKYWKPDLSHEIRFHRGEEYCEAFNELFERVVGAQLRSLTPVGVMMSGGLDSTAVAVMAARMLKSQGRRITAFTEVPRAGFGGPVPEGKYADETPFVQAVARMYDNLDLELIRTGKETFLDKLDHLFFHLERPFANASNRVWFEAILKEASSKGMRILLDGMQGNLTFSQTGSGVMPQLLRAGRWKQALMEARQMVRSGTSRSTLRTLVGQGLMPLMPTPLWLAVERLRGNPLAAATQPCQHNSPINPEFAAFHRVRERARDWGHDFYYRPASDSRTQIYKTLTAQDLGLVDRSFRTMFGVDLRSPPADVRIAEFCLALPEGQFLYKGETRSLIRRAMEGRLPPEVLSNHLRGQQAADWFERLTDVRGELPEELRRIEQCELARRALDLARMRRLVEHWPQGEYDKNRLIASYQLILERGLMAGRFLLWFEAGG
jgi:asparagine synthase (glutamine-hydrolysing)